MKNDNPHVLISPSVFNNKVSSIDDCLSQYLLCITKEADTLPEGTLCVRYRNGSPNFTKVLNRKVYGITKKPSLVYQLARRQFLTLQIPLIKRILKEGWTSSTAAVINEKCQLHLQRRRNPDLKNVCRRFDNHKTRVHPERFTDRKGDSVYRQYRILYACIPLRRVRFSDRIQIQDSILFRGCF